MKSALLILAALLLVACAADTGENVATSTPAPVVTSSPVPSPSLMAAPSPTPIPAPSETPQLLWRDVPYTPADIAFQKLDVYLPQTGDGPFPTILAIHGGGFRARTKSIYHQVAPRLTESGYAVVSTNYRLTPKFIYPAQVEDVFCALAWVHENHATYGFDTERIFVMGDSAGGYLASMIGTVKDPSLYLADCPYTLPSSEWAQGIVVLYGFYDLRNIEGHRVEDVRASLEPFLGAPYDAMPPETLAEMSPASMLTGSEPPFLLVHGTADLAIPSWLSENFAQELEATGGTAELILLEGEEHGFIMQPVTARANALSIEAIETFLLSLMAP